MFRLGIVVRVVSYSHGLDRRISGNNTGLVVSGGRQMLVNFTSDGSVTGNGFRAVYSAQPCHTGSSTTPPPWRTTTRPPWRTTTRPPGKQTCCVVINATMRTTRLPHPVVFQIFLFSKKTICRYIILIVSFTCYFS